MESMLEAQVAKGEVLRPGVLEGVAVSLADGPAECVRMNPGIASLEGKAALSVCGFGFELEASLVTWQTQTAEPNVPKCLEVLGLWPLRLPFAPAVLCRCSSEGVSSRRGHSILIPGVAWSPCLSECSVTALGPQPEAAASTGSW